MKKVDLTNQMGKTIEVMRNQGLLLCSVDNDGNPNAMAIGWGHIGILWGKPSFEILVRPSRYTFNNIENTDEFAICVPTDDMKEKTLHCGSVSGREHDKFKECNFTRVDAENIDVPLIGECQIFYECRVVHKTDMVDAHIPPDSRSQFYPEGDLHRIYYGEIISSAINDKENS